jgi:hypothetical protein
MLNGTPLDTTHLAPQVLELFVITLWMGLAFVGIINILRTIFGQSSWWPLRTIGTLVGTALREIRWNVEVKTKPKKRYRRKARHVLEAFPEQLLVFTAVMISTYNVGMRLRRLGYRLQKHSSKAPKLTAPRKPPDPVTGASRRKHKQTTVLSSAEGTKRLLLMGLLAANAISNDQVPTFELLSDINGRSLRSKLRSSCDACGFLQTTQLDPASEDMTRLRRVLAMEPSGLLNKEDSLVFIVDTGASASTTFDQRDFKPGSLKLFQPGERAPMQGIAGNIAIEGEGILAFQVVTDTGEVRDLETRAYYMPGLTDVRLFSPQVFVDERDDGSEFLIQKGRMLLRLMDHNEKGEESELTISYNPQTRLPTLRVYKNALDTAKHLP